MYKVIKNNEIIDVLDKLHYVRRNPRNGVILSCGEKKGQGVISHNGSVIYRTDDALGDGYDAVTLESIDEAEYTRLRDLLDGVEEPVEETPVEETDTPFAEEPEVREPMSIAEMREKIVWLEEQVNELLQKGGHNSNKNSR